MLTDRRHRFTGFSSKVAREIGKGLKSVFFLRNLGLVCKQEFAGAAVLRSQGENVAGAECCYRAIEEFGTASPFAHTTGEFRREPGIGLLKHHSQRASRAFFRDQT